MTDEQLAGLLSKHSPIFSFDGNESVFPMAVDEYLSSCRLMRAGSYSSVLVKEDVTAADLSTWSGTDLFLDEKHGTCTDANVLKALVFDPGGSNLTVYGRTWEVDGFVALQYWTLYAFNQGPLNSHEGDWEMVQVLLDGASLEPREIMLSQHRSGERVGWDQVNCRDSHPMIAVALGSHANYLRSEQADRWGDRTDGSGPRLGPDDYALVDLNDGGDLSWLEFSGRWGEWGGPLGDLTGSRGPEGPMFREGGTMWSGLGWTSA